MRRVLRVGAGLLILGCPKALVAAAAGADFLNVEIPARPASMAGAFAANSDDAVAFLWNPAALGKVAEPMLSATHFLSIVDTEFDQASFEEPLKVWNSDAGLGLNVQYDTTSNFDQIDALGNDLGPVVNYDLLVQGGAGLSLGNATRVGVSGKVFDSRLVTYKVQGFALDIGGQSDLTDRLSLGAALLNLGTQGAYDQVADPLPTKFSLAGHYVLVDSSPVLVETAAQLDRPWSTSEPITLGLGGEYWYARTVVFRAGWLFGDVTGPFSLGLGVKWRSFSVDYAYNTLGNLGASNRFSLTVALADLFERVGLTVDPIAGAAAASPPARASAP